MNSKNVTILFAIVFLYRLVLVVGCAYLVGWCGWSPWWFLFVLLIWGSLDSEDDEK